MCWSECNCGVCVCIDNCILQQVVKNLCGFSYVEVWLLVCNVICNDGVIIQEDLFELNCIKFQLFDLEGVLSFEYDIVCFVEVGGFVVFKCWFGECQLVFFVGMFGDQLKGMMLVGVQGVGKSLVVKVVVGFWGLLLLCLDFVCFYNKYFGEIECNLCEVLCLVEQMVFCVLWMDEVEKGIFGGDQDNGVSQCVLGILLIWMVECEVLVFMVVIVNVIDCLLFELICKGCFDELFFVDLLMLEVCVEIFCIYL